MPACPLQSTTPENSLVSSSAGPGKPSIPALLVQVQPRLINTTSRFKNYSHTGFANLYFAVCKGEQTCVCFGHDRATRQKKKRVVVEENLISF